MPECLERGEYYFCFHQDIAHLMDAEDSAVAQLPTETPLKIKFTLKPRKSEAYAKLEDSSHDEPSSPAPGPGGVAGAVACNTCSKTKSEGSSAAGCRRAAAHPSTFSNLPENVCDDIKTTFEDLDKNVCKSLPRDTFDDIPIDTFDDIEVAIEDA